MMPAADGRDLVHIATAAGSFNTTMSAVLRQQGFLESFNLEPDLVAVADGAKIMAGVYSGSVDIAPLSGFGQVFPAIERGAQLKMINASSLVPMLALYSGQDNVRSLKDLEGKVVGSGALGSLVHHLTVTLLKKHGVDVGGMSLSIGKEMTATDVVASFERYKRVGWEKATLTNVARGGIDRQVTDEAE